MPPDDLTLQVIRNGRPATLAPDGVSSLEEAREIARDLVISGREGEVCILVGNDVYARYEAGPDAPAEASKPPAEASPRDNPGRPRKAAKKSGCGEGGATAKVDAKKVAPGRYRITSSIEGMRGSNAISKSAARDSAISMAQRIIGQGKATRVRIFLDGASIGDAKL